jgi:hypothetical protein
MSLTKRTPEHPRSYVLANTAEAVAEAVEEAVPVPEAEAAAVEAAPMQVLAEAVAAEAVPMPTAEAVPMVVAEAAEVAAELRGLRRLRRGLVGRLGLWRL